MQIADAVHMVEQERAFVTAQPHDVARLNEARKRSEALATLTKAVKADKEWAQRLMDNEQTRELRDAGGRRLATLNHRAPMQVNQRLLRERFPKVAEEVTEPNPYDYVTFG